MTSWQAIRLVMGREMRERSRSGAFIVSLVMVLLFVAAGLVLPIIFATKDVHYEVGVLGEGNQPMIEAALALANYEGSEVETTIEVVRFDSEAAAERAADTDEVDGVLVNGSELVVRGADGDAGSDLERLLQRGARSVQIESLVASGEDEVVRILTSAPLGVRSLSGAEPEENDKRTVIAFGGLMLMYMAVLLYGSLTLTGVTEEKTNRVVEVLLAAFEPWQLLTGKIVGIGLLGLAQFVGTAVVALVGVQVTGVFDLPEFPIDSMLILVLWFILGYSLYAVAFGAAGALVSRPEDAQSVVAPISLIAWPAFSSPSRRCKIPPAPWPWSPPSSRRSLPSWYRSASHSRRSRCGNWRCRWR